MNKMLISIIVDNSATMKGEKITKLGEALTAFNKNLEAAGLNATIEYSVVFFDVLRSKVCKGFSDTELPARKLSASGIPMLNKAFDLALDTLETRIKEANASGTKIYKSWLILLSDGKSFGDMTKVVERLNTMIANGLLTYFPFLLSDNEFDESLSSLIKLKRPLSIINLKYTELFDWIFNTAKARVETPIDQAFSLDPKSFEGWVKR